MNINNVNSLVVLSIFISFLSKSLWYKCLLHMAKTLNATLCKNCVFGVNLVRIFPHLDWMPRYTPYLSVFSPNAGKYGPE